MDFNEFLKTTGAGGEIRDEGATGRGASRAGSPAR